MNENRIFSNSIKSSRRPDTQKENANTEAQTMRFPPRAKSEKAPKKQEKNRYFIRNEWVVLCAALCFSMAVMLSAPNLFRTLASSEQASVLGSYLGEAIGKYHDAETEPSQDVAASPDTDAAPDFDLITPIDKDVFIGEHNLYAYLHSGQIPLPDGVISSDYSFRKNPFYSELGTESEYEFHRGIDIAASEGEKILCYLDGTVEQTGYSSSYGNYVIVLHDGGMKTLYAHAKQILCEEGDEVSRAQPIALVGSTGRSTGPHLHFEVIVDGEYTDPRPYLSELYSRAKV